MARGYKEIRRSRRGVIGAGLGMMAAMALGRVSAQEATPMASPVAGKVGIRRNAKNLSPAEKKAFIDAILTIKATPSPWDSGLSIYDQFVVWHRDAFACDNMAAHMGPAFFPWHRMFLRLFEQQLQEVDPSVTIPYWDWAVDDTVDSYVWQDDFMGGSGDPEQDYAVTNGPFRKGNWDITVFDARDDERKPFLVRHLGVGALAPDLPTVEQVEEGLALATYDVAPWTEAADPTVSFRSYMEGWRDCLPLSCGDTEDYPECPGSHDMHNRVHLWVSGEFAFAHEGAHEEDPAPLGTMAHDSSPNDPIFILHHANMDRLWNVWMSRHGRLYDPESGAMHGHNLNDHMWPFSDIEITATPAMMLDSRSVGYVYDTD